MVTHTLLREKQRIDFMLEKYQAEISQLPKGTISEKKAGGKVYYYLKYRDGKKVVSQYVKRENIDILREQLAKRSHMEAMVKSLLEEKKIADKALEGIPWEKKSSVPFYA